MENTEQPLLYTPDFIASCFEFPGSTFSLAPTLYEADMPIAFIAGFPRRVRYKERELSVVLNTFLAVANEHKKKGYGVVLWSELARRAQIAGFDGMVNYCVEGEPMNSMILGCCRMLQLPTERVFSAQYHVRLFHEESAPTRKTVTQLEPESVPALLQAAGSIVERVPLARIWNEKEAEWQCRRYGAVVARRAYGSGQGMLTGYFMEVANPQRTKCLLIEDVLWGTLQKPERKILLEQFLDKAAAAGAQIATVPFLEYADMEPFTAMRFRRSRRILHAYLTIFSGQPMPEALPSMYLDVL
jgi:hypothetical protein